jgi:hypothetical protein
MRREILFECDTADFMIESRVAQALERACDHGSCQRLFRPLG